MVEVKVEFDYGEGMCGAPHPDRPDVTCVLPVKGGESFHIILGNRHAGVIPPGMQVAWPR